MSAQKNPMSRRDCLSWGAAAAVLGSVPSEALAAPKREKKHGRGHVQHHAHYEVAGTAPDSLNGLAMAKGLAFGSCLETAAKKPSKLASMQQFNAKRAGFDDPQMRALFVAQCGILVP